MNNKKGFTLIESIVAISILVTGILAVYYVFASLSNQAKASSNKLSAIYLAQEGIEVIRNIRDSNWINGQDWLFGILGIGDCSSGCNYEVDYRTGTSELYPITYFIDEGRFLNKDVFGLYSYGSEYLDNVYKRKITLYLQDEDTLKISCTVYWFYGNESYSVQIDEVLYNWYQLNDQI